MSTLVTAYVIYDGTTARYVGDQNGTIQLNCERLQAFSPRPVWLMRYLAPGDGTTILYQPTFDVNQVSPDGGTTFYDANTLQGFWIEQDSKDAMIDIATAQALVDACAACCDDTPAAVTRHYPSGIPSFIPLTLNTFCIFRVDAGNTPAHEQIALDYVNDIVGDVLMRSHISNASHYQVQSFWSVLKPQGNDTITSGICAS